MTYSSKPVKFVPRNPRARRARPEPLLIDTTQREGELGQIQPLELDNNGHIRSLVRGDTAQIFPTYYVYVGSTLIQTVTQFDIEALISLDATSFYKVPVA